MNTGQILIYLTFVMPGEMMMRAFESAACHDLQYFVLIFESVKTVWGTRRRRDFQSRRTFGLPNQPLETRIGVSRRIKTKVTRSSAEALIAEKVGPGAVYGLGLLYY